MKVYFFRRVFVLLCLYFFMACEKDIKKQGDWVSTYVNVESEIKNDVSKIEEGFYSNNKEVHFSGFGKFTLEAECNSDVQRLLPIAQRYYNLGSDYKSLIIIQKEYNLSEQEFVKIKQMVSLYSFFQSNSIVFLGLENQALYLDKNTISSRSWYDLNQGCLWATVGLLATGVAAMTPMAPLALGAWAAGGIASMASAYHSCVE